MKSLSLYCCKGLFAIAVISATVGCEKSDSEPVIYNPVTPTIDVPDPYSEVEEFHEVRVDLKDELVVDPDILNPPALELDPEAIRNLNRPVQF